MVKSISLDTGPITLFFTRNHSKKIESLFGSIKTNQTKAYVIAPVLAEVYKHLCIAKGKDFASSSIVSFLNSFAIQVVSLKLSYIIRAGELKCSYRNILSYNDCFVLAFAIIRKYELHTTEKKFPSIPHLKTIIYSF